jgi:hypothetical protein
MEEVLLLTSDVLRLVTGWTVRGSNPGDGVRFSAPVQTGPWAHPASCTVGVKRPGRDADNPPASWIEVAERVQLYLYSPSGPSP